MEVGYEMSIETYRKIDLLIFTLLAIILDAINVFAFNAFPLGGFSISLHIILSLISIIRWGYLGSVVAVLGGLSYSIITTFIGENEFSLQLITMEKVIPYTLGNLFIIACSLYFLKWKKSEIVNQTYLLILYVISGYVLICLGRSVLGLFFNQDFIFTFKEYGLRELFNAVIGIVIILIARKQEGMVEDVYEYLVRFQQSEKKHKLEVQKMEGSETHEKFDG